MKGIQMNQNMSKADLVAKVSEASGLSKKDASAALDAFGVVLADSVAADTSVPVPGLGKVGTRPRAERTMRNPSNGETFIKPAGRNVKVTIGKALKDKVDG